MSSTLVMGVLNCTPDSFSDAYPTFEAATRRAVELAKEGADIIDVGGESTRPGSRPVSVEEELARVVPVIRWIRSSLPHIRISCDTRHFDVAEAAAQEGATLLNDITAATDPRFAKLAKEKGLTLLLMHMKGSPETMQLNPDYPNGVVREVKKFLKDRVENCLEMGLRKDQIWIDPGIGFGKTLLHNLELLRHLDEFVPLAERLAIGASRKSFLSRILGSENLPVEMREAGTLATNLWAFSKGASILRVHDVGALKRGLSTWRAIAEVNL